MKEAEKNAENDDTEQIEEVQEQLKKVESRIKN